uniref:WW and C2 domain containing 1 n=1 Tax=Callorhinchus milii TaxID=7868 RepID=A0A4W3GII3_CALMI
MGWEETHDAQVGAYYIDHNTQTTQIEDPRAQWRREQERMLKDYLIVAQDALTAQKEIFQVKQQRLELAQQEYRQLNDVWKDKSGSQTSLFSGSSSSTKYDPDILKAEISTTKSRVNKLKRELTHMRQELQYKEQGFETLKAIDLKMSGARRGYKLDEAQAIVNEMKSIKKAINSGEKEKRDLMQILARLKDGFRMETGSQSDLWASRSSLASSKQSISRHCSNVGSQTDISGDFVSSNNTKLAEKVRLSLQYEEAKRRISNIKIELVKLASDAWPGVLDAERDRLILISEKEELLKELQFINARKWSESEVERLETERKRLAEDLQTARDTQSKALTERLRLHSKRNNLVRELEEATRLASTLHSQLQSLSSSTLSLSSGSSKGSLTSSRGSLAPSSLGSSSSVSFTDLYYDHPEQTVDFDYQYELDFLLQESSVNNRFAGSITTIHENEVVKCHKDSSFMDPYGTSYKIQALRSLSETPKSLTSLSPRSSLSSLSPPSSPVITETHFLASSGESLLNHVSTDFQDAELQNDFSNFALHAGSDNQKTQGTGQIDGVLMHCLNLESANTAGIVDSSKVLYGKGGVFASKRNERIGGKIRILYDSKNKRFAIFVIQLSKVTALSLPQGCAVYIRVAVLPCSENTSCLFRTKALAAAENLAYNEVFWVTISFAALRQKTLRVDVCSVVKSHREECLGEAQISLANVSGSGERSTHWYNLLNLRYLQEQNLKHGVQSQDDTLTSETNLSKSEDKDSVSALLELTAVELKAIERRIEKKSNVLSTGAQWYVDKETNTEENISTMSAVRPKDRRSHTPQQSPFVRGSPIIRSKTFSPGAQNTYICRLNRSDSDSSALSKRSPFDRNAMERRSLRKKLPSFRRVGSERMMRTSLDLELDLQASRTRQSRLTQELDVLRELKQHLDEAKAKGETELPQGVKDEKFHTLLKQVEKQQTKEQQKQESRAKKLMKKTSKEVHMLRGQSQIEPLEMQSFREKMAFFTRGRGCIPPLPADDV